MKPSPYNNFFEIDGGNTILAFNSYTGAMAEIEKENYPRIRYLMDHPEQPQNDTDKEFLQCLKDGGFLIPDGIDQTGTLRTRSRSTRLEGNYLTLTIAPTLACNFDCDYCFESHSPVRMDEATQNALLEFSDRYMYRVSALRICWFGGEPTLCFPMIDKIQSGLLKLAEKHRIRVMSGSIVSNGYLLDAAMARRLDDLGINQAQITIDGPAPVHDRRRKLRNGKGTFDRIIENLAETSQIMKISVRINVDKGNVDSACDVAELLQERGILPRIKIYFAQVNSSGAACSNIRDRCYDDREFSQTMVDIYGRLLDRGINKIDYPHVFSGAACGAVCEGHFVVSPTGHLFRCWEELSLDNTRSIGHLSAAEPDENQKKNIENYAGWDPFHMAACQSCRTLPICMGGCPMRSLQNPDAAKGICSSWKYNLKEMLTLSYGSMTRPASVNKSQQGD